MRGIPGGHRLCVYNTMHHVLRHEKRLFHSRAGLTLPEALTETRAEMIAFQQAHFLARLEENKFRLEAYIDLAEFAAVRGQMPRIFSNLPLTKMPTAVVRAAIESGHDTLVAMDVPVTTEDSLLFAWRLAKWDAGVRALIATSKSPTRWISPALLEDGNLSGKTKWIPAIRRATAVTFRNPEILMYLAEIHYVSLRVTDSRTDAVPSAAETI